MKLSRKVILLILTVIFLVAMIIACQAVRYRGVYVGMSMDKFRETVSEEDYFQYGNYLFFKNVLDGHIVACFSNSNEITKIKCYDGWRINASDDSFSKIEKGMSIEQVVSIVGIPYGSATFGLSSLTFESASGTTYVVFLTQQTTDDGCIFTVDSVLAR